MLKAHLQQPPQLVRSSAPAIGVLLMAVWMVTVPAHAGPQSGIPSETITLPNLRQPVEILIDHWGVPHIYAKNEADLFFAQGFNAARDRLFQIDLWRRRGLGQLSEVFGPAFVEQDKAARLFLYRGDMDKEWAVYSPDAKQIAEHLPPTASSSSSRRCSRRSWRAKWRNSRPHWRKLWRSQAPGRDSLHRRRQGSFSYTTRRPSCKAWANHCNLQRRRRRSQIRR